MNLTIHTLVLVLAAFGSFFGTVHVVAFSVAPPPTRSSSSTWIESYHRNRPLQTTLSLSSVESSDKNEVGKGEGPKGESVVAGPRGESSSSSRSRRSSSRQQRRSTAPRRQRSSSPSSSPPVATERAPHQFDHTKEEARPFIDAIQEIQNQDSNENAPTLSLSPPADDYDGDSYVVGNKIQHSHIETLSLDDLFPNLQFSYTFATNTEFRNGIRNAMREDIFNTTPTYANLSEKAKRMLLLPDSSLQGSWRCKGGSWIGSETESKDDNTLRMRELTKVLKEYLGNEAPTGDVFMDTIGELCGSTPQTHWIDIVGVLDRRIPHSWHQDTGRSGPRGDSKTVLLGFPPKDNYNGLGVFSHVVKLEHEACATEDHPPQQPILYKQPIDEDYIIRPKFQVGNEIIMYRDIDVLHSAPDVAYRTSVMRFM